MRGKDTRITYRARHFWGLVQPSILLLSTIYSCLFFFSVCVKNWSVPPSPYYLQPSGQHGPHLSVAILVQKKKRHRCEDMKSALLVTLLKSALWNQLFNSFVGEGVVFRHDGWPLSHACSLLLQLVHYVYVTFDPYYRGGKEKSVCSQPELLTESRIEKSTLSLFWHLNLTIWMLQQNSRLISQGKVFQLQFQFPVLSCLYRHLLWPVCFKVWNAMLSHIIFFSPNQLGHSPLTSGINKTFFAQILPLTGPLSVNADWCHPCCIHIRLNLLSLPVSYSFWLQWIVLFILYRPYV